MPLAHYNRSETTAFIASKHRQRGKEISLLQNSGHISISVYLNIYSGIQEVPVNNLDLVTVDLDWGAVNRMVKLNREHTFESRATSRSRSTRKIP